MDPASGPALPRRGWSDGHRLDRVDDHQVGSGLDHGIDDLAHVCGRQDQQAGWDGTESLGSEAHLVGRLLGRNQ